VIGDSVDGELLYARNFTFDDRDRPDEEREIEIVVLLAQFATVITELFRNPFPP
jgi:hypothetical protein